MKAIFKLSAVLIGIAALSLVEIAVMYWLGGKDVRNFCNEIKPGMPIAQLNDLARKYDVRLNMPGTREGSGVYLALASTPRSFGRHTCLVRHDSHTVSASQNGHAD